VQLFTTCQRCQGLLQATYTGQETCVGCEPTEAEKLCREFVDAIQRGDEAEAVRLEKLVNAPPKIPSLGSAALWYAKHGWPVFPLAPVGYRDPRRPEFVGDGKKPFPGTRGFKEATTDPALIKQQWSAHPDANIGGATGILYDVLDIDGAEGVRSLTELGDDVLPTIHGKAATPHNGYHYFIEKTGDGCRAGVRPGLDFRGEGGYVVLSPSIINGKRYTWLTPPSPKILKGAA